MKPRSTEIAVLHDYELVFDQKGIPFVEPAFASIKQKAGSTVWGVLYELSSEDFTRLHCSEGDNYQVTKIEVEGQKRGITSCETYIGTDSKTNINPSRRYLNKLVTGAKEYGLPQYYIDQLLSYKTSYIPIVSELVGYAATALIKRSAKGKPINLVIRKSGAKTVLSGKVEKNN